MSDAANLLSILRGELPIPPQPPNQSAPSPSSLLNDSTHTPTEPQVARQPSNQANQLLNQINSQSIRQTPSTRTNRDLPAELQEPPKSTPQKNQQDVSSQSLLSILKGFNPNPTSDTSSPSSSAPPPAAPVAPSLPPSTPSAPNPTSTNTPNFNFISPFDLLNSKKSTPIPLQSDSPLSSIPQHLNFQSTSSSSSSPSPSPSPSKPQTPSQSKTPLSPNSIASPPPPTSSSFPTKYLSYSSIVPSSSSTNSTQGLRIPSTSLPLASQPQSLSISPLPSSHPDSLTTLSPTLTPITLFPAQSLEYQKGRRIAICSSLIGYAVKKGRVRVIERESGERVLIDPFDIGKEKGKGKKGSVELGGIEFSKGVSQGGRRAMCVVEGAGIGRVAVWEGMDRFESSENADFRPLLITSPPTIPDCKFVLAKFHPNYPKEPIVAIVTNQGSVCLVNVEEAREGAKVEVRVEEMKGTKWIKGDKSDTIRDVTFSPDGSLLAILTTQQCKIYHTSSNSFDMPLHKGPLPAHTAQAIPSEISFLTYSDSASSKPVIRAVAISSHKGTQVDLIGFDHFATSVASIKLESPPDQDDNRFHYSQLQYHDSSSTLFVSSSLRGSIFAFKLAFTPLPAELSSDRSDSDTLSRLLTLPRPSPASKPSSRPIRISHVLEVPHPEPILSFVIDSKPHQQQSQSSSDEYKFGSQPSPLSNSTEVKQELGVLIHHPQGIQHVLLPSLPSSTTSASTSQAQFTNANPFSVPLTQSASTQSVSQDPGNLTEEESLSELEKFLSTGRRMSLEGSIKVNKRVEVEEERVDEVSWEFMRRASIPFPEESNETNEEEVKKRDLEVEELLTKKKEELPAKGDIANALNPATPREEKKEDEIKLSGAVVNAAIKNMKLAKKKEIGGPTFQNTYKNYSNASTTDSQLSSTPPVNGSIEEEGTVSLSPTPPQVETKTEDAGTIVEELRRVERGLPAIVEGIVRKELDARLRSTDDDTLNRDQELLRSIEQLVLDTESTTKRFMGDELLPAMQDLVSAELRRNLESAVRQILPREVSSILLDPDFTRSLATTLVPALEQTVTQLILSGLVPSFKHTLHKSVDEIMSEMKREMLGVRKEIVREQNGMVEELEQEVGGLRGEVAELKGMLQRMEGLMIASQQQQQSQAVPPPHPAAPSSIAASSQVLSPQASQPETLPPIPRSETPVQSYEDLLTTFLQPSESPSFPSLVHFLNSSPPHRLDRIFPSSSSAQPAISMAVTLSLAFRLSELVKSREGGFAENEKKWLEWLRRAVGARNDQQPPEFVAMIPRILDMVLNNLVTRGRNLMAVGDHRGAGEIRIVEQYARARLSMFSLH